MQTSKKLFIEETTVALWRIGNSAGPRMNHLRLPPRGGGKEPDIIVVSEFINGKHVEFVLPNTGGISLWDGQNPKFSGKWYEIPAGTAIPEGLCIKEQRKDQFGFTHYVVEPIHKMTLQAFIELLDLLGQRAQKRF